VQKYTSLEEQIRKGKLITDFVKRNWWWTEPKDKVWIDDVLTY